MRVVSLNIDFGEVPVVRRALCDAAAACLCQRQPDLPPCADCETLTALILDLDRLLARSTATPRPRVGTEAVLIAAPAVARQAGPLPEAGISAARRLLHNSLADA